MPLPPPDPKRTALQQSETLNPHPEAVHDPLFGEHAFFDTRDLVQVKYEMLRRVRVDGWLVRDASHAYGFSRVTFYQLRQRFEAGGLVALLPQARGPRRAHKLSAAVMAFVDECLAQEPSLTTVDLQQRIQERFGLQVHMRSIERARAREGKKRLA
jgi:transposase